MKILRALMLMLALSVCTYAGNMPNGVVDPPPPPAAAEANSTDLITDLISTVLALF